MGSDYANVHCYWCTAVFVYFAVGVVLCSLILSPSVSISALTYHSLIIVYTLLGLTLTAVWIYFYSGYRGSKCVFGSTVVAVPPAKDTEYAVVHALYVETAFIVIAVTFLFWIWFLIYYSAVSVKQIDRVLEVYSVVLLPLAFLIPIFFVASWWIPEGARRVSPHKHVHLLYDSSRSADYIEQHTDVNIHW